MDKAKEPENILPVFILTAPLWAAKAPEIALAQRKAKAIVEKFDPFKVRLGMTTNEVEQLFGAPFRHSKPGPGQILNVYGAEFPPYTTDRIPPAWIAIRFDDNKVTRVFSHHFFDKRLLK